MKIVVTGGASFIGSHLVEHLVKEGHKVSVLDDFSSGSKANLKGAISLGVTWCPVDLRNINPDTLSRVFFRGCDLVYHLAAEHGGRGFVATRQLATSNNFAIDNNVIQAAVLAKIPKLIYASSGCVYPSIDRPSAEDDVEFSNEFLDTGYSPDGLYGLAKLAGELTLAQAHKESGLESVSCRFFTVFGPRAKENHASISFIARAFTKQDPWVSWGDGSQVRDWTYVDDIVQGLLFSCSLSGCQAINLGTPEHLTVDQAVEMVLELVRAMEGYHDYFPTIIHDPHKPVGPRYRVGDSSHYLQQSEGTRFTPFREGLSRTIEWYFKTHDREEVSRDLDRLLIERK